MLQGAVWPPVPGAAAAVEPMVSGICAEVAATICADERLRGSRSAIARATTAAAVAAQHAAERQQQVGVLGLQSALIHACTSTRGQYAPCKVALGRVVHE